MLYAHSHQVCVASCVCALREEEQEANILQQVSLQWQSTEQMYQGIYFLEFLTGGGGIADAEGGVSLQKDKYDMRKRPLCSKVLDQVTLFRKYTRVVMFEHLWQADCVHGASAHEDCGRSGRSWPGW